LGSAVEFIFIHTPGNYPKEDNIRFSQHGESLKTRVDGCLPFRTSLEAVEKRKTFTHYREQNPQQLISSDP
jgi:hypothetical protein